MKLKGADRETDEMGSGHSVANKRSNIVRRVITLVTLVVLLTALMASPALANVVNVH